MLQLVICWARTNMAVPGSPRCHLTIHEMSPAQTGPLLLLAADLTWRVESVNRNTGGKDPSEGLSRERSNR